jgi:quinolinate synthase
MGNPLDARSAREALIIEALRGVDTVLAAADAVGDRLSASSQRLESAAAGLTTAGTVYQAEVAKLTEATKKALADYIERRASAATTQALAEHRKAMQDAATLAFAEQLAPAVRDIARQVELHGSLVRTRLAPVLAALAIGVALGTGGAVLWMR